MTPIPGLNTVEIEINSRCNRKCLYCPVSILDPRKNPVFMDDDVFERLITELARIEFRGRISYHFYNEPLLRADIAQLIQKVKEMVPYANQTLFTNGDLLTELKYKELIDAGIDFLQITSHSLKKHPNRQKQVVYFPSDLNLTNRGGTMVNLPPPTEDILTTPCYAPSEMLIVLVNGDVALCYEDAQRRHIMGNIMSQSLEEIWFSKEFCNIRQEVSLGRRANGASICRACSNKAHAIPGTSHIPTP